MKIVLYSETPSLNRWQRWHWGRRQKEIMNFILKMLDIGQEVTTIKKKLTVHSYRWGILDRENFIGGLKPLIDALKKIGLIVDDNAKWLEHGNHKQTCSRTNRRTEIFIEDWTGREE